MPSNADRRAEYVVQAIGMMIGVLQNDANIPPGAHFTVIYQAGSGEDQSLVITSGNLHAAKHILDHYEKRTQAGVAAPVKLV